MSKHPESYPDNSYDVITIGGGIGGLSAAAMLAKAGKKVLLVEKELSMGGLTTPLVFEHYKFDVGPRLLMGCNADGPFGPGVIHSFLELLGVGKQVDFIPLQPFADVHFPESRFQIWSGRERYIDGLHRIAPHGLDGLPALLDLCNRIFRKSMNLTRSGKPWTPWRGLVDMPEFIRYSNTTAGTMLSRYVPDQRARTVVGALWPYLYIPPSQASFLAWASMMATYIEEGAYYCRGGLHQLAEAIGSAYTRAGGEFRLGCEARRVLVQNRKVTGVELADGQRCSASAVIANIDPRQVFGAMMDHSDAPAGYRHRLDRLTPADTGVSVSFVTDLDLPAMGFAFENMFYDSWNEDQVERNPFHGQVGFFTMTITTAADPNLAPPGQHMVSVFAGLPLDAPLMADDIRRYSEIVMDKVLNRIPELEGHLLLADHDSVPRGYLQHAFGPIYGWKTTPWQASLGRPDLHTPVKGLVLAGHWTRPIQGIMPAILSGCEAARIILRVS